MPVYAESRRPLLWTPRVVAASGPALTPPVTSGLVLQLDANQGTSSTTNNASLSSWTDTVGSNAFVQATGANQPTYITNGQNGLPVVRFSGSQWLQVASAISSMTAFGGNFSIFWWSKGQSSGSSDNWLLSMADRTAFKGWAVGYSPPSGSNAYAGWYSRTGALQKLNGASAGLAAWHENTLIVTVSVPRGTHREEMWQDGTLGGSDGSTGYVDAAVQAACVGAASDGTSVNLFTGDAGELLVYNRVVSSSEQTSIEGYGRTKWGTP